ncbi:DUF1499 domain-containing protein [Hyphomonas sp.]|uniref:DUF1499 domain-containing protein n=1 Tax=Hyphomonas sp. TaxID=87 RepID=UPI00391AC610
MAGFLEFGAIARPASPNTALVAPPGYPTSAEVDAAAPVFPRPPEETFKRLLAMIDARRDWKLAASDPAALKARFVAVTPLMRFKDDVDLQVLPADGQPGQSTLVAYSRSRVGYSDLGTNLKRLKALCEALSVP